VSLVLERGVLAVVGRNGMGKTTLCNAITGLVPARGSVRLAGEEILGLAPNVITGKGIGYVPQGRRVWPSLSVDEHLRLAAGGTKGPWTVERIYATFPRLAERKGNGGAELSGGEQQMLAIGRALLFNPKLLVMDEPTEGLAPVIVQQVAGMLKSLAADGDISVLLIEQNLGVAIDIADTIDVMVNGRIARSMPAAELAADRELQQRLLGVKSGGEEELPAPQAPPAAQEVRVYTVKRAEEAVVQEEERTVRGFTRWGTAPVDRPVAAPQPERTPERDARVVEFPVAHNYGRAAYIAGTFDTKGKELSYLRNCLEKLGLRTVTVDLATSGRPSPAMVHPREVARHHPKGESAVFTGDRGSAVTEMAVAFEQYVARRRDLGGLISAGGSGGTALATRAMRRLPIGVPKVMVSTVASGDVRPYVGPADICMMYSVTDIAGINRISERVLANAAHALAGMIAHARPADSKSDTKPAIGLTMFGLTTPCVQAVTRQLEEKYDCIVFHATGTGGQSMEKLAESGLLHAVIDVTTTEIADEIAGGVLSAGPERMDVFARARLPYVGSCGALDMVNFWAWDTVPERYKARTLYKHNPNVTLMRTSAEECAKIGRFIAEKLNRMEGPVRFLIPEGGLSGLDAPGKPFWDPAADKALFDAIATHFRAGTDRKLIRLPLHINDQAFADALVAACNELKQPGRTGAWPASHARKS
jgi:uncharacterized protein (UPF0261 family)/ABC-type branched-subunit amino acid transport system ATPase component